MITKDNYSLYASLFDKINTALQLDGSTEEKAPIGDIGDYFLLLEEIKEAAYSNEEGTDPSFLILPADEGIFEINANTRTITVPSDFAKNGVAVKGDELAEIVYFSIDRYFDLMDLFDKEILIQWELPNGDSGYSAVINKTRNYIKNKVVFGWPITSELTAQTGNVKFSVRFYSSTADDQGKEYLTYSFGTLASTIKINTGLDFIFNSTEILNKEIIDKKNQILSNLKNSSSDNVGERAAEPVFVDLSPSTEKEYNLEDGNFEGRAKFDINNIEGKVTGSISYSWEYADAEIGQLNDNKYIEWKDNISTEYRSIKPNETRDTGDIYWVESKSVLGQYEPYTGDWTTDSSNPTIYKLYNICTPTKAGVYRLKAHNYAGRGNTASAYSSPWRIAYAKEATIDLDDNINFKLENGKAIIDLSKKIISPDEGKLSCRWFKDGNAIANNNEDDKILEVTTAGDYRVEVTNEKNKNTKTVSSDIIKVREAPETPVLKPFAIVNGEKKNDVIDKQLFEVESIGVEVSYEKGYTDEENGTAYQWYKQNNKGDAFDVIIGATENTLKVTNLGNYRVMVTNTYNTFTAEPVTSGVFSVFGVKTEE